MNLDARTRPPLGTWTERRIEAANAAPRVPAQGERSVSARQNQRPLRRWQARSAVALLGVGLIALSGCSSFKYGGGETLPPSAPNADPLSSQQPAEPEAAPNPNTVEQTVSIEDGDGYTFDVAYRVAPLSYDADPSAEKPGYTAIRINLDAALTVTNTTPGRNLTFRPIGPGAPLYLMAQWPADSAICAALASGDFTHCAISLAWIQIPQELGPDESTSAEFRLGSVQTDPGVAGVPEDQYGAVLDDLQSPASYTLVYSSFDNGRFQQTCPNPDLLDYIRYSPASEPIAVQQFNFTYMPIYDSSGTCSSQRRLAQPQ